MLMVIQLLMVENMFLIVSKVNNLMYEGLSLTKSLAIDLASSTRMQTYRFLPTVTGMPTDATIIMHVFQQYLYLKEPYAIPPLIPVSFYISFILLYLTFFLFLFFFVLEILV